MESRSLPASPLLLQCGSPLDKENREEIFRYASQAARTLLQKDAEDYERLKLLVFDGTLIGRHSVSELAQHKYKECPKQLLKKLMPCVLLDRLANGSPLFVCSIKNGDNGYSVMPPRRIAVRLKGNTKGLEAIENRLSNAAHRHYFLLTAYLRKSSSLHWFKISSRLMNSAANDRVFISRFNSENFFKGADDKVFSAVNLNLYDSNVRIAFAALYAMTFYGLTVNDIFSVSNVFAFSPERTRSKDDTKHEASIDLCRRLERDDSDELAEITAQMGRCLLTVAPPAVDPSDNVTLARNLTLYEGVSGMGKAYINSLKNCSETLNRLKEKLAGNYDEVMEKAELFTDYENAVRLCDNIISFKGSPKKDVSSLDSFRKTRSLQNRLETYNKKMRQYSE